MNSDKSEQRDQQEELVFGGVCPVCGEEFVDGFDAMEEMTSYEGRICVTEVGDDGQGHMLVHLPNVETDGDSSE